MQKKIDSFFKPPPPPPPSFAAAAASSSSVSRPPEPPPTWRKDDDELEIWEKSQNVIVSTYKRRSAKADGSKLHKECNGEAAKESSLRQGSNSGTRNLNKKRNYAQFHLELGQSDFLLRTCSTCGVKYAPGDELDEKNHNTFHKSYTQGIPFKGWLNERVVNMPCNGDGRIIMVLDNDSPSHRNKVQEVVKMMEIDLGGDWILHKLCKVYLFICAHRITGCLIAEPIKEAFRIIPGSEDKRCKTTSTKNSTMSHSTTLQFGNVILQREVLKKSRPSDDGYPSGAIVCEENSTPAICGVRAIWVTPSNRRKGIAAQLLDALRSFSEGVVLEKSQLAFSQPSSIGKSLASSYFGDTSFLVYKADDTFC